MEDFNFVREERKALLGTLQDALGNVPPHFWAACQICDIQALKDLIAITRINPATTHILAGQTVSMVRYWTQSTKGSSRVTTPKTLSPTGSSGGSPGSSPINESPEKRQKTSNSPMLVRSTKARLLATQRDKCCVITGQAAFQVAHIYPFYALANKEDNFGPRNTFWNHLKIFWPKEKVAAWELELFPEGVHEGGIETVYNLITLSYDSHVSWNRGAFALKPISLDSTSTTLRIQFFWQQKQEYTQPTMSLLTTPTSTEDLDHNKGAFDAPIKLFNNRTDRPIKSGDFFDLTTDDPIQKPLPSFKLLEMQWFLQRVVGMAGAAFPHNVTWGVDDSDDDVSNLGLEEVNDDSLIFDDTSLPDSPQFLRKDNLPIEGSKHPMEEAEAEADRVQGTRQLEGYLA